jgi:1,4-dihydroxy-2-naphthoate octaprenyltransferase
LNNSKLNAWILASRPKTLLAAFVPVVVGSALAIEEGLFVFSYSLIALICSILIQVGTNFTNDLYDFLKGADNINRKGPLRVLAAGIITVNEMKAAIIITFAVTFFLGLNLVNAAGWIILVIGILSIIAGIAYTAGPYPLAYNGLGDIFVFIFFGIIGTAGTYYLHSREFPFISLLVSIPVGALITNILLVNNYRDVSEDRSAGKRTTTVILGKEFTRLQYIVLMILSFLIPFILFINYDFSFAVFLPYLSFPLAVYLVKMLYKLEGKELNKTLELTAKFSALFGILFSIGLVL